MYDGVPSRLEKLPFIYIYIYMWAPMSREQGVGLGIQDLNPKILKARHARSLLQGMDMALGVRDLGCNFGIMEKKMETTI